MTRLRLAGLVAVFALHGLAREVDRAVGLLLHTTLDLPRFVLHALALLEPVEVALRVGAWAAGGVALAATLAAVRARAEGRPFRHALADEARAVTPLCLRPALTLLALVSLALRPTWPYAFTLPVALTQDWGPAQDVAAVAALVAARWRPVSWPAPGPASFAFLAFLGYALLTPAWAWHWDNHPGNEPKTLRMAVALGHRLSLDVEPVSAPMEELPTRPLPSSLRAAARTLGRQSVEMAGALAHGPSAVGLEAMRASPMTRQTIRGKDGGVYYVLAPGPSLLLAPLLRADRALNLLRGTPGRLTVTLLVWNALAAGAAAAVFLLLRDATRRAGLAALAAAVAAFVPPALFYAYQFYPEMLAAGATAVALRALALGRWWSTRTCLGVGLLLAGLPWLHQKFLPLWAAFTLVAILRAVHDLVPGRGLAALLFPQAVSLYLTALYNFAITGSVRPDAVFQAWGFGVSASRVELGILGLPFDARYGLLPYVPAFLLAVGGLGEARRALRFPLALSAGAVYFLTVAAADNWAGPISHLGRFMLPLVPVLALLGALALARTAHAPGVRFLALALAGWSAVIAAMLWRDPHAANDCALLLARSTFAEGTAYIPNLYLRSWSEAPAGTAARVAAWLFLCTALALWLRHVARRGGGASPARTLAGVAAVLLLAGFALERWPVGARRARFGQAIDLGRGATAFLSGAAEVSGDHVRARSGRVHLLVRSPVPLAALEIQAEGTGIVHLPGRPAIPLPGRALGFELPLRTVRALTGRRGAQETLYRQWLEVDRSEEVVFRMRAPVSRSGENGLPP
ncbi:MAG TPA: hypothetical protein VMT87_13395 [Vicinamibacteria bacterium]|nr:hypothetical protein [Vicinamibacteria bacterium]